MVLLAFFLVLLFLAGAGFTLPGGHDEEIVRRDVAHDSTGHGPLTAKTTSQQ
jgi:hypothetical protein